MTKALIIPICILVLFGLLLLIGWLFFKRPPKARPSVAPVTPSTTTPPTPVGKSTWKSFKDFISKIEIKKIFNWSLNAVGIAFCIVALLWLTGLGKGIVGLFLPKEVDPNATLPTVPVKSMKTGTYTDPNDWIGTAIYHDRGQYFRPTAKGKRIRFILRSCTDQTKYIDQSVEITPTGTIPDQNIITHHNSFDIGYEWYTFTLVEGDGVTFSYEGLPSN